MGAEEFPAEQRDAIAISHFEDSMAADEALLSHADVLPQIYRAWF